MQVFARQTVSADIPQCRFVAHRGLSGVETENTCAAFLLAAQRGYWGIETDVHGTTDGKFVICHDANLKRVSGVDFDVRRHTLGAARKVALRDFGGEEAAGSAASSRSDLRVPEFRDYLSICAKYGKHPVIELKDPFSPATLEKIVGEVRDHGILDDAVFISFLWKNCLGIRKLCPNLPVMNLDGLSDDTPLSAHLEHRIGADFHYGKLDRETVSAFRAAGLPVCAWTVDDPALARSLADIGVEYLTTNVLEPAAPAS